MRRRVIPLLLVVGLMAVVGAAVAFAGGGQRRATDPQSVSVADTASGLPPVPQNTTGNARALSYVREVEVSVAKDKACRPRSLRLLPTSRSDATPSRLILATFGVLQVKQPQQPLHGLGPFLSGAVYAKYIRVAQRRYGITFEVGATANGASKLFVSPRCQKLKSDVLSKLLAGVAGPERRRALMVAHDVLLDLQYTRQHPETICLIGDVAGCQGFLYADASGWLQSSGDGGQGSVWSYLVPNGVATVTAHYPAEGPKTGFRHHWPRISITAPVINNVAVWRRESEPGDIFPTTITWRSVGGRVIKVVYPD